MLFIVICLLCTCARTHACACSATRCLANAKLTVMTLVVLPVAVLPMLIYSRKIRKASAAIQDNSASTSRTSPRHKLNPTEIAITTTAMKSNAVIRSAKQPLEFEILGATTEFSRTGSAAA